MNPALNAYLAHELISDQLRKAERFRASSPPPAGGGSYTSVTVRRARPEDAAAIERLEELEGRRLPRGPVLLAEVDAIVLAARSLESRQTVTDPFRPTAQLVELLHLRALHLRDATLDVAPRGRRFRRLRRALSA
jgi:hypothetical protein